MIAIMERTVSTLTLSVALAICGSDALTVKRFHQEADAYEYMIFTHFNYFYSYPEYGKKWKSGNNCEFHRVHTKCHICGAVPERNYAGVGSLFIINIGRFATNQKNKRMVLLCNNHISDYCKWNPRINKMKKQLSLF